MGKMDPLPRFFVRVSLGKTLNPRGLFLVKPRKFHDYVNCRHRMKLTQRGKNIHLLKPISAFDVQRIRDAMGDKILFNAFPNQHI